MSEDSMLDLKGQTSHSWPAQEDPDPSVSFASFLSVLKYCGLIILAPIITFFGCKAGLGVWGPAPADQAGEGIAANVMSAVAAIVVLHLALGVFIYKAYFEGTPAKKRLGKQDQSAGRTDGLVIVPPLILQAFHYRILEYCFEFSGFHKANVMSVRFSEHRLVKGSRVELRDQDGYHCQGTIHTHHGDSLKLKNVRILPSGAQDLGLKEFFEDELATLAILDDPSIRTAALTPAEPVPIEAESQLAHLAEVKPAKVRGSHFKIDRRRDLNTHLNQLHHVDMATVLTQRQLEPPEKLVEFHLQDFHPFQMPKYSQISCHMEGDKFAHRFLIEFGRIREDFWRDPDTPPELMCVPRKFYFIDRFAGGAFDFALDEINAVKLIGVSVQGHVSRGGALSTMSVSTKAHLFVFDLSLLGLDAIIHRGLGDILASPVIMKVIHDVRFLSDFLHHECQVILSNVYDTLAAHSLFMTWRVYAGYMPKFASTYNELAKAYFGLDANSLHFRHVRSISPEEDLKIWFQRPLEDHLLQGAVRQTMFLLDLQRATRECMNAPFIWATEALMSTVRDSDDMEAEVQKTEAQVLPRSVLKVLPRLEPDEARASKLGVVTSDRQLFCLPGQMDNNVIFSRDCMHQNKNKETDLAHRRL